MTLMRDPVRLPTSGNVVDRSTIAQHLLNDETGINPLFLTRFFLFYEYLIIFINIIRRSVQSSAPSIQYGCSRGRIEAKVSIYYLFVYTF